ncbi:type II secretion system protein [Paraburkholderia sp. BCC1886]|uniref:type II secretion system protein n=1 Tax=Paraburkholderia sp. BCC1886 TaxID=2562670 RepID=UPI001181D711|nr:type II secretion system protein [Paraburkholderia sp. BCC1886]
MARTTAAGKRRCCATTLRRRQKGFSFLLALLCVALMSLYLFKVAEMWSLRTQRLQEQELLRNGDAIRRAIEAYVLAETNGAFPRTFDDLVSDPRTSFARRFLRRAYADPLTQQDWKFIRGPQGELYGVYSGAEGVPLKQDEFPDTYASFALQKSYEEWKFVYYPSGGMMRR